MRRSHNQLPAQSQHSPSFIPRAPVTVEDTESFEYCSARSVISASYLCGGGLHSGPLDNVNAVLTSAFLNALRELRNPPVGDVTFSACQELAETVLFLKRSGVPLSRLIKRLEPHKTKGRSMLDASGPTLSSRHHQIIQPFIRHVYATDSFLGHSPALHTGPPKHTPSYMLTVGQARRYARIHDDVREGHASIAALLAASHADLRDLCNASASGDARVPVPTRLELPRLWEDILMLSVLRNWLLVKNPVQVL